MILKDADILNYETIEDQQDWLLSAARTVSATSYGRRRLGYSDVEIQAAPSECFKSRLKARRKYTVYETSQIVVVSYRPFG